MPVIKEEAELHHYVSIFEDIWSSMTVRVSLIEVGEELIPNGEIVLSSDTLDPGEDVLYEIDNFRIIEKRSKNPIEVIESIGEDDFSIGGTNISDKISVQRGNVSSFFQGSGEQSRVFQDRPYSDLNGLYNVEVDRDDYDNAIEELEDQIRLADEPYFNIHSCEQVYFDHHFRGKSKSRPLLILVGPTYLDMQIDDQNQITIEYPQTLEDHLTIKFYPIRPIGEDKGRTYHISDLDDVDVDSEADTASSELSLDMQGIEEAYINLYLGTESIIFEDYINPNLASVNPRYQYLENLDQGDQLQWCLEGNEPDNFEIAVLNLFSMAGYSVLWFGDEDFNIPGFAEDEPGPQYGEIDIIAHSPDHLRTLFVECTVREPSSKFHVVDRMEDITAEVHAINYKSDGMIYERKFVPCIATSQTEDEIADSTIQELDNREIELLSQADLLTLLELSRDEEGYVSIGPGTSFELESTFEY